MLPPHLRYPNETPIEEVKEKTIELEKSILAMDEVQYVFSQVGSQLKQLNMARSAHQLKRLSVFY